MEYFEKETKYSRTFTKYQTRKSFEEIEAHNRKIEEEIFAAETFAIRGEEVENYEDQDEEKVRFRVMEKM